MTVAELEGERELNEHLEQEGVTVNKKMVDWARDVLSIVKKGVIAALHIGRARFEMRLTTEVLGLDMPDADFQDFMREYLDLGTMDLLPKRIKGIFDRIEGKARRVLKSHAFETPWGYFVPFTAFDDYKAKREECRLEYEAETVKLKANLALYNAETLKAYRKGAEKIYERTEKTKMLEEFTQNFVRLVELQLPTAERIDASFYFNDDLFYIPLPSELEEDFMKADIVRRERMIEDVKAQADADKIRSELQMHKDTVAKVLATKQEKLDGLITTISTDLRGAIYNTLRDVLDSIKDRESLSGGSVKSLKLLIERTRMMNFVEDAEVESALSTIDGLLKGKGRKAAKKAGDTAAVLRDIAAEFRAYALSETEELPDIRDFGMML